MHLSRSTIVFLSIGIVIVAAIFYLLFGTNSSAAISGSLPPSSAEQTFLTLTSQIDPVELDTSILTDLRFTSLEDIRTAVIPEASGRSDPFAPLTGVAASR